MRPFYLFLVFVGVSQIAIFAQAGEVRSEAGALSNSARFQRFTAEDGLPIAGVSSLFQDSHGFIWVGSFIGLSRFDGYRFFNYANDAGNPSAISALSISSIIETRSGRIWIGTANGLNLYDEKTDGFRRFNFDPATSGGLRDGQIRTIFEDSRDEIWVGTSNGGLSRFDDKSQSFTTYQFQTAGSNMVGSLVEDNLGGFWMGTNDGLYKFDRDTGIAESIRLMPNVPATLGDDPITAMIKDRAGIIWLGTAKGLCKFDPSTGRFAVYKADVKSPKSLNDDWVRTIYETKTGVIWIGTNSGLNRYSRESDDFATLRNDPSNPNSLGDGEILAVLEDANDQLWVGGTGGLNKFNQRTSRFVSFRHDANDPNSVSNDEILSIFEDSHNIVWIGTRSSGHHGTLNKYDIASRRFETVKELGDVLVYSIYEDREGKLWFGSYDGIFEFDRRTQNFKRYNIEPGDRIGSADHRRSATAIAITEDSIGNLMVATVGDGLQIIDRNSGVLRTRELQAVNRFRSSNNRVYAILEDRQKNLWFATAEGLERIEPVTQSHTVFRHAADDTTTISADETGTIYEDSSGTIWIGTSSGGLNRFDRESSTFSHFSRKEGLPSSDVFGIMEDGQGNLWLCTDRGLVRFNIATGSLRTYNVTDGVPNNPFDNKTAFKNQRGEMYFGGQNGFVRFDPRDFTDSNFRPPVYLSEIRILEQPLKTGNNLAFLDNLELSWRDYVVSFDFAALDFTDPRKIQYQWKLDGFDPDWINGGTRRTATYSNLPGGDYVLKVKATNVDGLWTDEAVNLRVHVQPPFFRTVWFWGTVALAIGILLLLAYRYRIGQLRVINEAQTRFTQQLITSQEAERKRIAAELHDGLGQSLVIIKNRAMLGLNKSDDKERVAKELGDISDSASQALDEVREITNNLRPQLLDRLGLTKAIIAMLKKYSGVIDIKSDIDIIDKFFEEKEEIGIYRIVQESMNNTIKHSNASTAKVKIKRIENRIVVEILDNGKGFDAQNLPTEKRSFGLTGLRERAQLLGGELVIDSQIGVGTKVSVTFPTRG